MKARQWSRHIPIEPDNDGIVLRIRSTIKEPVEQALVTGNVNRASPVFLALRFTGRVILRTNGVLTAFEDGIIRASTVVVVVIAVVSSRPRTNSLLVLQLNKLLNLTRREELGRCPRGRKQREETCRDAHGKRR